MQKRLLLNTHNTNLLASELEAVSSLLTLFDLQDDLSSQLESSTLTAEEIRELKTSLTLLNEVIQDSCAHVRFMPIINIMSMPPPA